jgi:hypothetical protein
VRNTLEPDLDNASEGKLLKTANVVTATTATSLQTPLLAPCLYAKRKGAKMNANPQFLSATATVDEAAIQPLPNSRKIYVQGSRPDIRVPMREISQSDTPAMFGSEKIRRFMSTILPVRTPTLTSKLISVPACLLCVATGLQKETIPKSWLARLLNMA